MTEPSPSGSPACRGRPVPQQIEGRPEPGGSGLPPCRSPLPAPLLDLGEQPVGDLLLKGGGPDRPGARLYAQPHRLRLLLATPTGSVRRFPRGVRAPRPRFEVLHDHQLPRATVGRGADLAAWDRPSLARRRDREWRGESASPLRRQGDPGPRHRGGPDRRPGGGHVNAPFAIRPARGGAACGEGWSADPVLANHRLPHVDDLDGCLAGIRMLMGPDARLSTEFVHALRFSSRHSSTLSATHTAEDRLDGDGTQRRLLIAEDTR
jgi:hypothetical protein